jgi:hypothetical protein
VVSNGPIPGATSPLSVSWRFVRLDEFVAVEERRF